MDRLKIDKLSKLHNKLTKVFLGLDFYLAPSIFVGTQWLKYQAKIGKILTNGQLLIKFVNIFVIKILFFYIIKIFGG